MHTNFSAISSERDIFDGTRACLQYVRNTPPPSPNMLIDSEGPRSCLRLISLRLNLFKDLSSAFIVWNYHARSTTCSLIVITSKRRGRDSFRKLHPGAARIFQAYLALVKSYKIYPLFFLLFLPHQSFKYA